MNDRRFTELLNLYVDHQISADEASELEQEVQGNPQRLRVYNDYCRLQRACSLLGEHARAIAPASHAFARSIRDAERKISEPARRPLWANVYVGSFAATAMAACVAVVIVTRQGPSTSGGFAVNSGPSLMQNEVEGAPASGAALASVASGGNSSTTPTVAASMVATSTQPPAGTISRVAGLRAVSAEPIELQSVFAATNLGVVHNAREAEIVANDRGALEWMQRVEALQAGRPLVDELAFEARPVMQQDNRVFRSRGNVQSTAEFTAFQFQR